MKETKYKAKRFLLPILSLVLLSIISIATINTYMTISMFKAHMKEHIEETKENYTLSQKNKVFRKVNFVNDSINFQITTIENRLKASLKEKIEIALDIVTFTYNTYKDTHNKEELKEKISKALAVIKFNDKRSYYFMYDNKTKVIFGHPLKSFIGKDMTSFKDVKGQSLMETDAKILEQEKIGFNKIYFNKPNNQKKEFPKITCITKFEPLDLVLGIGEYLDVIEDKTKKYVLSRFSQDNFNREDEYIVILDVHSLKGGDDFATVLLNSNRPELVGKKVSDKSKDVKGNLFRKDFLDLVVKKGEGYHEYWYKKPSTSIPALKLSYFLLQKDWNWIIASGFYYEDLEKQIANMKASINSHTNNTIRKTIFWVSLLSFVAILIAVFVSFKIDRIIKKYTNTIIKYEDNKREQEHLLIQQSKMAAMGEMLENIAHQWRQPLSVISTSATGAKLQNDSGLLNKNNINTHFDTINNSAQYLSQTIEDFRNFFNSSKSVVNEFNIFDTLTKTLNLVNVQFTIKEIEVIKDIEPIILSSIENELIQVLINILNNARDALVKLDNQKRLIFINTHKNENSLVIEVKDNAKGIPEDIIDRIFEPYFTTKHKSQGTGIGLYMSLEIIRNHLNGSIKVENENYEFNGVKYRGCKFTINIPIN